VHDGVEVEVDHVSGGQAGGDGGLVQRGQQRLLPGVFEPVGVGRQRGGFGQRGQAGEQGGGRVGGHVVHVGDPTGAGELERQQAQQVAHGRDVAGAGIPGGADHAGQIQGEQVRDGQQQPGHAGRGVGGEVFVVLWLEDPGPGQVLAAGAATHRVGAPPDPRQPGLGDDFVDPGAVQRYAFAGQHRADLVDRVALGAQLDDPGPGGVLARGPFGAGTGVDEEVPGPGGRHDIDVGRCRICSFVIGARRRTRRKDGR
jgi:hypothetical protein